jgi:two-component system cell cycle response regulator DivK
VSAVKKILVIDDEPDIVDYLTSLLEDHGYETRSASDSRGAFTVLQDFRPDTILVDVLMPGRSGLDLLVRLRRDERWRDIPIVVVTGHDMILQDDCQSYLGAHHGIRGPDGVLGKPVDPAALLAVVKHINSGS